MREEGERGAKRTEGEICKQEERGKVTKDDYMEDPENI